MFGRRKQQIYVIELTAEEFRLLRECLIERRNELLEIRKPTEDIDELLIKICKLK